MLCKKIRQYLIDFLVGSLWVQSEGDDRFQRRFEAIGYTDDPEQMKLYPIVIIPSGFFKMDVYGTEESMPTLPLKTWRGIPLLFGEPRVEWSADGSQLIIYADLLASTYFLISRYEEMYRRSERDSYGRFPGKSSLPYRAGFLHRPIIDEYGEALRQILLETGIAERHNLRLEERPQTFSRVNLTHDLSRPYNYRGWRSFLRAWLKQKKSPLEAARLSFSADVEDDYFTFPKFLKWDRNTCDSLGRDRSDIFLFIRMPSRHPLDKPYYSLHSLYLRRILSIAAKHKVLLALQCSYAAGHQSELISKERHQFEKAFRQRPRGLRHNKLTSCEPEDLLQAYVSGFRNDYSMGYADVVGFRLGTCRPVKFINPNTRLLTELILHPLVLRDLTLSDQRYMALEQDEAERIAHDLIRTTARYNGELTLLWHNDLLSQKTHPWHSVLYRSMLRLIEELGAEPQA
ncbi:MAG: hypothetical protein HXM99_03125 [Porphyromonadaceae bacterium]|nr:hypothetical protein [Porphyromonadaceae bacterium]